MAREWREVATADHARWRAVFNDEPRAANLASPCPICGSTALHRWYHVDGRDDVELRGVRYVGPGRLWEWCSSCFSYEHFRDGYVPEWWTAEWQVPAERLAYDPGPVEEARVRATAP